MEETWTSEGKMEHIDEDEEVRGREEIVCRGGGVDCLHSVAITYI